MIRHSYKILNKLAILMAIFFFIIRISSAILRQATYGTIKFGTYYSLKRAVIDIWAMNDLFMINIVCAALAGAISSAIANPTDVVKVRMQVTGGTTNISLFTCFQDVYKHEGIRGLWRVIYIFLIYCHLHILVYSKYYVF